MTTLDLTTPEGKAALAVLVAAPQRAPRTTRKAAAGPYVSRCNCGDIHHTEADRDRHVAPGHTRFTTITEEQGNGG